MLPGPKQSEQGRNPQKKSRISAFFLSGLVRCEPVLLATPEKGHYAAITTPAEAGKLLNRAFLQLVRIVGLRLHHFSALLQKLRPVVGRTQHSQGFFAGVDSCNI
jgi:hypothetical protein